MTGPLGTADFFALEAGECLDRLENLAARPDGVPADEFLRVSRALRGSALMAGRQPIARAAAALELLARAVRDQRRPWDAAAREQSLIAVEELRLLVRRGAEWTEADTARAERLAHSLEGLAGRRVQDSPRTPQRSERGELTPGVRAFVARECTLVAGALDRASRTARTDPAQRDPLYEVLRRMQSLRGLAELGELSPLPEILDGLELALGDLTRIFAPPPEAPAVLEAGARALSRVSREVADQGRPTPDADDAREFTDLLLRAFAAESDVVPIEQLFAEGDAEPIRRGALSPAFEAPGPLGAIELLSHGEHLYQIADQIERARSRTERDLKLYGLVAPLRSLATGGDSPVRPGLVAFAEAARAHIAGGTATDRPGVFADVLREAGALLRSAGGRGEHDDPVARLHALAARLQADATLTPAVEAVIADAGGGDAAARGESAAGEVAAREDAAVQGAAAEGAAGGGAAVETAGDSQPDEVAIVPIQALAYTGEPMIVEWGSPTDAAAGESASPDTAVGEPASSDTVADEAARSDTGADDGAAADVEFAPDHAAAAGVELASDDAGSDRALGGDSVVDRATTEQSVVEQRPIEQSGSEQPGIGQLATEQPAVDERSFEQPAVEVAASERDGDAQPANERPLIDQPPVERTAVDQPPVEQPTNAGSANARLSDAPRHDHDVEAVDIASLAPSELDAPGPLEASWAWYEHLTARDEAAAAPGAEASDLAAAAPPELEVVEIGTLLYRGRGALERADAVRTELAAALGRDAALADIRPLIDELVDLVPLALE